MILPNHPHGSAERRALDKDCCCHACRRGIVVLDAVGRHSSAPMIASEVVIGKRKSQVDPYDIEARWGSDALVQLGRNGVAPIVADYLLVTYAQVHPSVVGDFFFDAPIERALYPEVYGPNISWPARSLLAIVRAAQAGDLDARPSHFCGQLDSAEHVKVALEELVLAPMGYSPPRLDSLMPFISPAEVQRLRMKRDLLHGGFIEAA